MSRHALKDTPRSVWGRSAAYRLELDVPPNLRRDQDQGARPQGASSPRLEAVDLAGERTPGQRGSPGGSPNSKSWVIGVRFLSPQPSSLVRGHFYPIWEARIWGEGWPLIIPNTITLSP